MRLLPSLIVSATAVIISCSGGTSGACQHLYDTVFTGKCGLATAYLDLYASREPRYVKLCEHELALPGTGFDSGYINTCADAWASRACTSTKPVCEPKPGTLGVGSPCGNDTQCQSLHCEKPQNQPCGSCVAMPQAGEPCRTSSPQCFNGLTCASGTCAKLVYGGGGAACDQGALRCDDGFRCDYTTTKTCIPYVKEGGACTGFGECEPLLLCSTAKVCAKPPAEGEDCTTTNYCASGLRCDQTTKKCVKTTLAKAGEPCGGTTNTYCEAGSCSGGTTGGVCPTIIADGQPCDTADKTKVCDPPATCSGGLCMLGSPACQ